MASRKTNGGATSREIPQPDITRDLGKPELPSKTHSARNAKEKTVTVTFTVTVPEGTSKLRRSVFLAGTLQQLNQKLVDWDTRAQQMKKVDDRHWTISLTGPENAVIEYKYTLGDWDHVERDAHCQDIANRCLTLITTSSGVQAVEDVVQSWRGVDPCGR